MAAVSDAVPRSESGVELNNLSNPTEGSHREDPQSVTIIVPESSFPHEEIQNVLWIEDSKEHRVALKEWDRKESYLSKKVDRKEKRSADLTNHIFNIVGFFSVFQGVVLTAVSQLKSSNTPLCGMVWVPALLSSVAAVVTIIGVWIKFSTLEKLGTSIHNEKVAQTAVAARATKLRAKGENFNFSEHAREGRGRKPSSWILISRIGVILSLFFFTGLFILAYVVILCNSLAVHKWNQNLQ